MISRSARLRFRLQQVLQAARWQTFRARIDAREMPLYVARANPVMVVNSLTLLGSQNGIQTGQLELPGGLPESIFKGTRNCNFLSDSARDFPGGFPESNFKCEIGNFLPDPGQELPGGIPESNF